MVLRIFVFLLWIVLGTAANPLMAAEGNPGSQPEASSPAIEYPGLSELGNRATAVSGFVGRSEDQLVQLADLSTVTARLEELVKQFESLNQEIKPLGNPEDWYVDRLTHYSSQYLQVQETLINLQNDLAKRQLQIDAMRKQIVSDLEFWKGWAADLAKRQQQLPAQTLNQVNQQLQQLNKKVMTSSNKIVVLQERISNLQSTLITTVDHLTLGLEKLRQATFRKNAPSFASGRFYEQFDARLIDQTRDGFRTALKIDRSYLEEHSFQLGMMLALFFAVSGAIAIYGNRFAQTDEWRFVLNHPLAVGCFVAVILFWGWSSGPPPLLRFLLQAGAVLSAVTMTMSLVENRRQAWTLWFAGVIYLVSVGMRMISLPQPLFRLYIALLALIFIPLLLQQVRYSRQQRGFSQGKLFRSVLRIGIVVLAVSLVGQVAGFINFSTWLIQASFETAMVILLARMTLLLSGGTIDVFLKFLIHRERGFFIQFGAELGSRMKRLLRFLIVVSVVLYLLPVWRLFTTFNEAWSGLLLAGFSFGENRITLEMLALALFSFYLAMQVSWLLQGMSDTQLFSKTGMDHGVRDAIKKLIHYAIVLVGFLIALGFVGLKLQNFIVLLSAFGVGIGFGLQDIVNNFLSGLILLFERPIKVGDGVLIDNEYGIVTRIGLRSTVVENLNQAELIVPNSQIISQKMTNWTLSNRRVRLVLQVGVAYGSDLEKVLKTLQLVAEEHPDVLDEPKPMPLFTQFGASSLDFELRVWLANIDLRPQVQNELLLAIDRHFREQQIEIPFPQRDLHLRSVAPGILSPTSTAGQPRENEI